MRREDLGLREHGGEADVERDVVLVDEAAGLARHLVHHPGAQRRQRAAVVLGDVAGVVADGGEDAVRGVGDEAVRPEVLGAGVEVRRELHHRVAQLIDASIQSWLITISHQMSLLSVAETVSGGLQRRL